MGASGSKDISNLVDVRCLYNKGGGNQIDSLLETELNDIIFILLGEGGEVDDCSWKIHVLFFTKFAVVLHNNFDTALLSFILNMDI